MGSMDFIKQMETFKSRIDDLDSTSGLDDYQPWPIISSGARKTLAAVQRQQVLALFTPEVPIIMTGYENRFGQYSSANIVADANYTCIARIPKFSFSPNHHFFLICENDVTHELCVFERKVYHHVTEQYGYLYNCAYMDGVKEGSKIHEGDMVRKSTTFDKFNNQCTGVNLNVLYMALDQNMEDSVIISESAADKMAAPLVKIVTIMVNENDIPINYYGDDNVYKAMPDIGEQTKDAILLAFRKEKKDDALFMQSVDRLKKIIPSDDKYLLNGTVMDVNLYCNNPENLNIHYNGQFKMYYNEQLRFARDLVACLIPQIAAGKPMNYELQKLYANAKRILNGDQYIEKRQFSNMKIEITVLERRELQVGDKISNRYGGKGVISKITPTHLMPQFDGEYADVLMNSSTMVNRENPGQLFEMEINFIGSQILKYISTGNVDLEDAVNYIVKFVSDVSPAQGADLKAYLDTRLDEERAFFVDSVVQEGHINVTAEVMKNPMTIDRLRDIYADFPFVQQVPLIVPITDSNGNVRYIPARRNVVAGKEYMLRLKQYAAEKFSATSLSATNLRGENTKSKAARDYRLLYSNTPIRMGNMEILDLDHLGPDVVITALLLHSVSPHARKLVEQFSTGDPYITNIRLDDESTNRQAEIAATYLRAIGLELVFTKHRKQKVCPIVQYEENTMINPIIEIPEYITATEDMLAYEKAMQKDSARVRKLLKTGKYKVPITEYKEVPAYKDKEENDD